MSRYQFANRASALVVATVAVDDLAVSLEAGGGGRMPVLSTDDAFRATLINIDGTTEIVEAVNVTGDIVTISARGQEGTAASTFPIGSRFEVRMTAGMATNFLQRTGDSMNGPLDMVGNQLLRANMAGSPVVFGTIHATFIRSQSIPPDQAFSGNENAIVIPTDQQPAINPRRPYYMGRPIVNSQMLDGIVFTWYGDINNVPPHLKLCDGTNGTPDLRGRFIKGWRSDFGVGAWGGQESNRVGSNEEFGVGWGVRVDPNGQHSHGGGTAATALSNSNLPAINVGDPQRTDVPIGTGKTVVQFLASDTYTGSANHAHGIAVDGSHNHFAYQPPFYVLAYVMFNV
jgi:hypothetical protein